MLTARLKSMLLVWMIVGLSGGLNSSAFAQSTPSNPDAEAQEFQALIDECDLMLEDLASQRDRAILEADLIETERDENKGQLLFVLPRLEALEDENYELKRMIEDRPSRVTWALVGGGAVATVALVVAVLLY